MISMRDGTSDGPSRAERGSTNIMTTGIAADSLQSRDHRDLLDIIDKLRSQGISRYVDLPQIIVCGEQSSGKSSVLEAISRVSFPTKDNLCTRFATELILRRSPTEGISVSIVPGTDRSEGEKANLRLFSHSASLADANLSAIIEEAKTAMGLDDAKNVFSTDILRVEISGPAQPHLTMVDLPGLFQAGNRAQSDEDAELVKSLVLSYMKRPRSIILAVVSAKNDFANQAVTRYARELDREGMRTLGLITKPDTLDKGSDSERAYVELAQNKDVKFRLGWAVLRNRDYNTRNSTSVERDRAEEEFFSTGVWSAMDPSQLGVAALRSRLSRVLKDQILFQLPSVIEDVEAGIIDCTTRLERLGAARRTLDEQRRYLLQISQTFTHLMVAAVDADYNHTFFGSAKTSSGSQKRLRAVVQNTHSKFAEKMSQIGHAREIVEDMEEPEELGEVESAYEDNPPQISRSAFIKEVKNLMKRSRGRELPGTFNPLIVGELFREQCNPWQSLIDTLTDDIFTYAARTVDAILEHSSDEHTAEGIRREIIEPTMTRLKKELQLKTTEILEPHYSGHPITYNQDLTENVQKAQAERLKKNLSNKLREFFPKDESRYLRHEAVLEVVLEVTEVDMDCYACSTAIDFMEAYYKVARKKVVDDISALAIERCLIQKLKNLFSPEIVIGLEERIVTSIATEPGDSAAERGRCNHKLKVLQEGLGELNRLKSHRSVLAIPEESFGYSPCELLSEDCSAESIETAPQVESNANASPAPLGTRFEVAVSELPPPTPEPKPPGDDAVRESDYSSHFWHPPVFTTNGKKKGKKGKKEPDAETVWDP